MAATNFSGPIVVNGVTVIDENGNIDAPVTTTNLSTTGNTTIGDASGDTNTVNATSTFLAPITVGVNGTGHDVKLFGDTASKFMVWDQSADDLILADAVALQLGGDESTADGFKLEFDGTSTLNLDALTANDVFSIGATTSTDVLVTTASGTITLDASANTLAIASVATTLTSTLTVGVNDTGHDVKFFGATASKYWEWDESTDTMNVAGKTALSGVVVMDSTTTSTGAGAVAITGTIHEITTTGTGDALTLADGTEGQHLRVVYVAEGAGADTAVLTPTNLAGASTTITFNAIGDTADLLFTAGTWFVLGGAAIVA